MKKKEFGKSKTDRRGSMVKASLIKMQCGCGKEVMVAADTLKAKCWKCTIKMCGGDL